MYREIIEWFSFFVKKPNLDPCIRVKYVNTNQQIADVLDKEIILSRSMDVIYDVIQSSVTRLVFASADHVKSKHHKEAL